MPRQDKETAENAEVKYSAAYSTGRERMLEPRHGCAEEALLRREASPPGEPEVMTRPQVASRSEVARGLPARGRARAYALATLPLFHFSTLPLSNEIN